MADTTARRAEELERDEAESTAPRKRLGRFSVLARRFARNKPAVGGLIIFALLALFGIFGELVVKLVHGYEYASPLDYDNLSSPPSALHWFGTTMNGADLFARVAHGMSISLRIAVLVSLSTTVISAVLGSAAAYFGGWTEKTILWVIHFLLVVPGFLILALFANASGGKWWVLSLALISLGWMFSARVVWSMATSLREREFVKAARFMGVNGFITVVRHLVPNIGSLLVIQFALGVVSTVAAETSLSYLGFGIKPPDVSLGSILAEGIGSYMSMPWMFLFPAGALTLLTVSMALVADGLRDALDPTSAAGGKA